MAKKTRSNRATSTPTGRQNVILERLDEQQRVVIEAVTSSREALERRMDELDQKLSSRFDVLEFAVRTNSADIRKNSTDILKNSTEILKNSTDIRALSDKLDTKADASRVTELEDRVEALERPGAS